MAKLDRLTPSLKHLDDFVGWCRDNDKTLVSVSESIDMSTAAGQMFVQLLGVFAEFERERIAERISESRIKTRSVARWTGGRVPYGYQADTGTDGHLYLVPRPSEQAVVQRIADAVISGTSVTQVVRQLNAEGIPSQKSTPEKPVRWMTLTVLHMLRNPVIRGQVMHEGRAVLDADGQHVTREPLIDDLTWAKLQSALSRNATGRGANQRQKSPLLVGVARCSGCGEPMYARRMSGRDRHYHECRTRRAGGKCTSSSVPMAELQKSFRASLDEFMGGDRRHIRVEVPAVSHEWELAKVQESIASIEALVTSGEMPVPSSVRMLTKLEARREELATLPSRPAGWDIQLTDETWAEYWATLDDEGMRAWLISEGLTITVRGFARGSAKRFEMSQIRPPVGRLAA